MEDHTKKLLNDTEKIMLALKNAGVVIPADPGLPARVIAEMSKRGMEASASPGGFVLSHYLLVWSE